MKPIVLLVDNNADYRQTLRPLLELEGYHVEEAASVTEAINIIERTMIDIALVDLCLQDPSSANIDGLEVVKRAHDYEIPCVVVTAYDSPESARDSLRQRVANPPAVDYVPKRYGPEAVLRIIQEQRGLTLLTISDLHLRGIKGGDKPYNQDRACEEFISDVKKQRGVAFHPIESIIVAGDISFRCETSSFNKARQFLTQLAAEFSIAKEQIVLVPGNHDINRVNARKTRDHLAAMQARNPVWFSKFDDYLEFSRHFYHEPAFCPDKLYRIFTLNDKVSIVAFNSCLIEGEVARKCRTCAQKKTRKKEHYYGWINQEQIKEASEELDRRGLTDEHLRIAVLHHHVVPETYQPTKGCRGNHLLNYDLPDHMIKLVFFEHGFRVLLHGHRHKADVQGPPTVDSESPLAFGSGALWASKVRADETANYLLLQLSPSPGKSRVIMRRYYPGERRGNHSGYWGDDPSMGQKRWASLPEKIAI